VDFAEVNDNSKKVAIITNYKEPSETLKFVDLRQCYPMVDIFYSKGENIEKSPCFVKNLPQFEAILDSFSSKTKVRVNFEDFESYCEAINVLDKYKEKFILFTEKKNFINNVKIEQKETKENIPLKESLVGYLEKNDIDENIKNILLEELK
jgi:hypothetical protein